MEQDRAYRNRLIIYIYIYIYIFIYIYIYTVSFQQTSKEFQWRKDRPTVLEWLDIHMPKNKLWSIPDVIFKVDSKYSQSLNVKVISLKLLEGENLYEVVRRKSFHMWHEWMIHTKKNDILDFIKVNRFSCIKIFQRMKIIRRLCLKILYLIRNEYL